MSENVHKGHRERMRQRFLAEGAKGSQTMNYWNYCCIMLCRGEM